MALDVQPISPTRKAVMLIVLLALFIASLGLAQWIVGKRRQSGPWSATGSPAFEIRGPSGFEPGHHRRRQYRHYPGSRGSPSAAPSMEPRGFFTPSNSPITRLLLKPSTT